VNIQVIKTEINEQAPDKILFVSVSASMKKLLCTFVGFYQDGLYRFALNNKAQLTLIPVKTDNEDKMPRLLIIARKHYQEQVHDYPIENKSELKKLLALEYGDNSCCHIWQNSDPTFSGKHQVNIWQFEQQVPNSFIRLPETLLLALTALPEQIVSVQSDITQLDKIQKISNTFIGRQGKLVQSSPQTVIINSTQRFASSMGIAQLVTDKIITAENYVTELALAMKKLSPRLVFSFIKVPKVADRLILLKNIGLPLFLVLAGYLAITSLYLIYQNSSKAQQLKSQSSEVTIALQQQQSVDKNLAQYLALQDFFKDKKTTSHFWLTIAELFPQAQFSNMRTSGDRFVLRGKTEQATQLLELLSKNKLVKDAKFDFPTRKNRGQENFVISFTLSKAILSEKNDTTSSTTNSITDNTRGASANSIAEDQ
jgi:hypothetical protein